MKTKKKGNGIDFPTKKGIDIVTRFVSIENMSKRKEKFNTIHFKELPD